MLLAAMTKLLQDFAAGTAQTWAGAAALVMDEERMTYAELERRGDRLAAQLLDAGCKPGDRVALLIRSGRWRSPRCRRC
jgi:non-ribosomal peptide synthetase component E (peptide arylation enzyme)